MRKGEERYCKDCEYFEADRLPGWLDKLYWGFGRFRFAKCRAPGVSEDEVVALIAPGLRDVTYCATARKFESLCGRDAKFYRPTKTVEAARSDVVKFIKGLKEKP